jgi:formylglycine-generating enzyme required for sulfatase activity
VPAGKFIMGSKDDNELAGDAEKPQHTIDLDYDFWMSKFILTNEQYGQYLGGGKHPVSDWQKKKDHPVVNVSWDEAMKYCGWFNQTFKSELGDLLLRLPTEAEWEKAARGAYGNEWPWGNEFDPKKCNSAEGRKGDTTPVGAYSAAGGDSPYGCADMVGNVWEWTNSLWASYPYIDEKSDGIGDTNMRILRGGSFRSPKVSDRCATRNSGYFYPSNKETVSFRVIVTITSP